MQRDFSRWRSIKAIVEDALENANYDITRKLTRAGRKQMRGEEKCQAESPAESRCRPKPIGCYVVRIKFSPGPCCRTGTKLEICGFLLNLTLGKDEVFLKT